MAQDRLMDLFRWLFPKAKIARRTVHSKSTAANMTPTKGS